MGTLWLGVEAHDSQLLLVCQWQTVEDLDSPRPKWANLLWNFIGRNTTVLDITELEVLVWKMQLFLSVLSCKLTNSAEYRKPFPTYVITQYVKEIKSHARTRHSWVTTYLRTDNPAQAGWLDILNIPSPPSLMLQTVSPALCDLLKKATSRAKHTEENSSQRQWVEGGSLKLTKTNDYPGAASYLNAKWMMKAYHTGKEKGAVLLPDFSFGGCCCCFGKCSTHLRYQEQSPYTCICVFVSPLPIHHILKKTLLRKL